MDAGEVLIAVLERLHAILVLLVQPDSKPEATHDQMGNFAQPR